MPLTPETWLGEQFVVNLTGTQNEPQITQLADGRILVAWEDNTNAANPGTDIFGQLYNQLGEAEGGVISLNTDRYSDDEGEFEIAATPDGGWLLAYEDTDGATTRIVIEVYNSSGVSVDGTEYTEPAGDTYNNPAIAVNGNGDAVIAWNIDDGTNIRAEYVFYDESAGTFSAAPTSAAASSNGNLTGTVQNFSVAALSNNSFVVTTNRNTGSTEDIGIRLITSSGAASGVFQSISDNGSVTNHDHVDVTGLTGGGFVSVWREFDGTDRDAYFMIHDNAGSVVQGRTGISTTGTSDDKNEISVAALSDGGFVIVWDDDETNEIRGQRYDATGSTVGSEFLVTNSSSESQPEVIGFADGRFAVTWQTTDGLGSQSIEMEIFDVRDNANTSGVYTPEDWQIGTVGNDSFTATADSVNGYDGNDTIADGSGANQVFGGDGNDSIGISGISASESRDGGDGTDWLFGAAMSNGTVYDLLNEEVRNAGGTTVEATTNFENVQGSSANEEIIGDQSSNELNGGGGNDTITGGTTSGSDDTLRGEAGNDVLNGGQGNGQVYGGTDNDLYINADNYGYDDFDGGTGTDTLDASDRTNNIEVNLEAELWGTLNAPNYDAISVEEVRTGSGNDRITGFTNNQFVSYTLDGGGGNDTIIGGNNVETIEGGTGNDSLSGGGQADVINGGNDNDTIEGGAARDTVNGGSGNDTFIQGNDNADVVDGGSGINTLDATSLTNTSGLTVTGVNGGASYSTFGPSGTLDDIDIVLGSNQDDDITSGNFGNVTIEGNGGDDSLRGGGSNQTIEGGAGNDTIDGGFYIGSAIGDLLDGGADNDDITAANGNDNILGGTGNDTITANNGDDTILGEDGEDSVQGGGDADSIDGGRGRDTLEGNNGDDYINGGGGVDLIIGGNGFDTLEGGFGGDTIEGRLGEDDIQGGGGNDLIEGGAADDTLRGGAGEDTLRGGSENDSLSGNLRADVLDGGSGNDTLRGNEGRDTITGGDGDDSMRGETGADSFIFEDGFGNDTIADFDAFNNAEEIDLSGVSAITDYTDLTTNHMTQVGGYVIIDDGLGNTIRLNGVNIADLNPTDFVF